jgi:hypothetical protein
MAEMSNNTEEIKEEVVPVITEETQEEVVTAPVEEPTLPEWIYEAGRNAGLGDEDIVTLSKDNYPKLQEMGFEYLKAKAAKIDKEVIPQKENEVAPPPKLDKVSLTLDEGVPPDVKGYLENLVKNQNLLIDQINRANEKLHGYEVKSTSFEAQQQKEHIQRVDAFFDDKAEVCPQLGSSKAMNRVSEEAREQVYAISQTIKSGTLEQKLDKAVKAYLGMTGAAESTIRRQLEKSKTKFSPRPGGRKTNTKFDSKEDEAFDYFMEQYSETMR